MHIDFGVIIGWIISIVVRAPKAIDIAKDTLDATKSGMEVFEAGKKLIEKDAAAHPEQTVDRARAIADMTRSLGPLAFAEVLFYAVKTCALLIMLKWLFDFFNGREAKRIVEREKRAGLG